MWVKALFVSWLFFRELYSVFHLSSSSKVQIHAQFILNSKVSFRDFRREWLCIAENFKLISGPIFRQDMELNMERKRVCQEAGITEAEGAWFSKWKKTTATVKNRQHAILHGMKAYGWRKACITFPFHLPNRMQRTRLVPKKKETLIHLLILVSGVSLFVIKWW